MLGNMACTPQIEVGGSTKLTIVLSGARCPGVGGRVVLVSGHVDTLELIEHIVQVLRVAERRRHLTDDQVAGLRHRPDEGSREIF